MIRRKYTDCGIRPKGSPEIAVDPDVLIRVVQNVREQSDASKKRQEKAAEVFNLIIKIALKILPPKQRQVFYSVWGRSGGRLNKGVMEFSRKRNRSHFTSYNNYYKAIASVQSYLSKTGYEKHILEYLNGATGNENSGDDLF
jgi:hypothetical protein